MIDLAEIGRRALLFSLMFSVFLTIIALGIIASGEEIPDTLKPLLMSTTMFYGMASSVAETMANYSTNLTTLEKLQLIFGSGIIGVGIVLDLLVNSLTLYLKLMILAVDVIGTEVPGAAFLVPPIVFVSLFLQAMVYYYLALRIKDLITSITPITG